MFDIETEEDWSDDRPDGDVTDEQDWTDDIAAHPAAQVFWE